MIVLSRLRRRRREHPYPELPAASLSVTEAIEKLAPEGRPPGDPAEAQAWQHAARPVPVLAESVPGSPAQELAAVLTASEMPGTADLRRLLHGLRGYNPSERGATMPNPVVRELPDLDSPPPAPAPVPASNPPGPVLLSVSAASPIAQPLAGMPGWKTASGRQVLHLGADPASPAEAFALAGMSDEWLDALAATLAARPGRKPRLVAPTFTPAAPEGGEAA